MTDKKTYYVEGKCEWACVYPGQEKTPHPDAIQQGKASPNDRHYEITVECSRAQFREWKNNGLNHMHQLKEKDDDSTWLKVKSTKIKGSTTFEDPKVTGPDGQPFDQAIGNGSVVKVEISLEPSAKGSSNKALRLKGVQVLEHVVYVKKDKESVNTRTGEVLNVNDVF